MGGEGGRPSRDTGTNVISAATTTLKALGRARAQEQLGISKKTQHCSTDQHTRYTDDFAQALRRVFCRHHPASLQRYAWVSPPMSEAESSKKVAPRPLPQHKSSDREQ
uniref:Uncharacterized protein n=3 Tax=Vibrionaceae TaxID=641 RepID=A0A0H3ZRV7_VIBSP|nr:hypothetical protein [Vibrio splendidus]AKN37905.1 hypothetical protein [Vibrio sp. FF_482]AKN37946.1 hypothetical protein [Enterovibrio norvegicus]